MKTYQIKIKIYYKGPLSKKGDIGHLTIEFEIDNAYYKKHKTFVKSHNSYELVGEMNVIVPKCLTELFVKVKDVKEENIKHCYDASFTYSTTENVLTLITLGIDVSIEIGFPEPVNEDSKQIAVAE